MLAFIYSHSDWLIAGVFVAASVALAFALMRGLRAVLPIVDDKDTFDFAIRVMPTILSVTAFVLAFAIVQAQSQIARTETVVSAEATSIGHLDKLLLRLDPAATAPTRAALAAYARSVVADEWPYMRSGKDGLGHPQTRERFDNFAETFARLTPAAGREMALFNDAIRASDQIELMRDERLHLAGTSIPILFWGIIGLLSLILLSLSAFFRPTLTSFAMIGSQAAALGGLIGFLFILDHPFMGETSVSPKLLERVITDLSVKP